MMAGWAFCVRVRSLSGPSHMTRDNFCDSASSTSWKISRAGGNASASALPMPTAWLPCPGNRNARVIVIADKPRASLQVKRSKSIRLIQLLLHQYAGHRAIADALIKLHHRRIGCAHCQMHLGGAMRREPLFGRAHQIAAHAF